MFQGFKKRKFFLPGQSTFCVRTSCCLFERRNSRSGWSRFPARKRWSDLEICPNKTTLIFRWVANVKIWVKHANSPVSCLYYYTYLNTCSLEIPINKSYLGKQLFWLIPKSTLGPNIGESWKWLLILRDVFFQIFGEFHEFHDYTKKI